MGALQPVAGSKIYIGRRVANKEEVVLADFNGAPWLEIQGWTSSGSLGDTQEVVTQNLISRGRTLKAKGTKNAGRMDNTFVPMPNDPGQQAFKAAIESCSDYEFKVEWGADCAPEDNVTITIANPGVITWPGGHGLEVGAPIQFSTTGALPTGLVAGTTYYVIAAGFTPDKFSVAATPGGAAIVTTGVQNGVHTATAQPAGQTDLFYGLAFPGAKQGGEANASQLRTWGIEVNTNVLEV
jgi:hypothetical protein